jgi:hypothetical protein
LTFFQGNKKLVSPGLIPLPDQSNISRNNKTTTVMIARPIHDEQDMRPVKLLVVGIPIENQPGGPGSAPTWGHDIKRTEKHGCTVSSGFN